MHTLTETDATALTAPWTVVSDAPEAGDDPDRHAVVTPTGTHVVDRQAETCSCDDAGDDGRPCAHRRRVAYAVGAAVIPAWVELDAVADRLGEAAVGHALVDGVGPSPRRLDLVRDGSGLDWTARTVWRAQTTRRVPAGGDAGRREGQR